MFVDTIRSLRSLAIAHRLGYALHEESDLRVSLLERLVQHADAIRKKGVDAIACLSVNDAFVMDAWGKAQNVGEKVMMLADGNADFSKAVGLTMDGTNYGMGTRASRYAMVIDNGVVKMLNVEAPGAFEVSSAEAVIKAL